MCRVHSDLGSQENQSSVFLSTFTLRSSSLGFFRKRCFWCSQDDHEEGPDELPKKAKNFIASAAATYDADFYVKVDDDVYVNPGSPLQNKKILSDGGGWM